MAEEADFFDAMRGEGFDFCDDFACGAGIFVAAHGWDDAIAAAIIASDEDGDVCLESHFFAVLEGVGVESAWDCIFAEFEDVFAFFCRAVSLDAFDEARDLPEGAWADGEVEARQFFEDVIAEAFDGASHEADHFARGDEVACFADGFLFGLLANGAGVDNDELGRLFVGHLFMPRGNQECFHGFGVADVHLTAIGMDEKFHERILYHIAGHYARAF